MSLMTAHRIFISVALVFCLVFFVREVVEYTATGSLEGFLLGIASGIAAVILGLYLRWLLRQGADQQDPSGAS